MGLKPRSADRSRTECLEGGTPQILERGSIYGIYTPDAHMPWLLGRAINRKPFLVTLTFPEIHPSDSWFSALKAPKPFFVRPTLSPTPSLCLAIDSEHSTSTGRLHWVPGVVAGPASRCLVSRRVSANRRNKSSHCWRLSLVSRCAELYLRTRLGACRHLTVTYRRVDLEPDIDSRLSICQGGERSEDHEVRVWASFIFTSRLAVVHDLRLLAPRLGLVPGSIECGRAPESRLIPVKGFKCACDLSLFHVESIVPFPLSCYPHLVVVVTIIGFCD